MLRNGTHISIGSDQRTLLPGDEGCRRTVVCDVEGCDQRTTEGKPKCSDHIGLMPYIAKIMREIASGADRPSRSKVVA